jgi:hypothetical protein
MTDRDHPTRQEIRLAEAVARIDDHLGDPSRRLPPAATTRVALDAAWLAYQAGRAAAIAELVTTQQVADDLGITVSLVRRYARERGIGWEIGRDWLFRPEDVERLRARKTTPGPAPR